MHVALRVFRAILPITNQTTMPTALQLLSQKMSDDYFKEIYDAIGIRLEDQIKKSVITLEDGKPIKINETWYPLEPPEDDKKK